MTWRYIRHDEGEIGETIFALLKSEVFFFVWIRMSLLMTEWLFSSAQSFLVVYLYYLYGRIQRHYAENLMFGFRFLFGSHIIMVKVISQLRTVDDTQIYTSRCLATKYFGWISVFGVACNCYSEMINKCWYHIWQIVLNYRGKWEIKTRAIKHIYTDGNYK